MGSNDHNPTGSASLTPWKSRGPQEVLHWGNLPADLIVELVTQASKVSGYVGFGNTSDGTALLLYVKNGRLNERVAIESVKEAPTAVAWVLKEWLSTPR